MRKLKHITLFILALVFLYCQADAQTKPGESFGEQNSKNNFKSFAFGMGIEYGNNPQLVDYIEDVGQSFSPGETISSFSSGFNFFGAFETQVSRNISFKLEYSYLTKGITYQQTSNYDFSYYLHQPLAQINYIIPGQYHFIKIGAGLGAVTGSMTERRFGTETDYKTSGVITKLEGVLNLQISKGVAGYLGGYISSRFTGGLKAPDGTNLMDSDGKEVNLNGTSAGLRLGIELYFF